MSNVINKIENSTDIDNNEIRNKKVKEILKYYKSKTVTNDVIKKINLLHPKTKFYKYIKLDDIRETMLICSISLDLKKQFIVGMCLKIFYDYFENIDKILLYNPYKKLYWYIKPGKYYLFEAYSKKNLFYKEYLDNYKNIVLNK
jgi:hypothetical protein